MFTKQIFYITIIFLSAAISSFAQKHSVQKTDTAGVYRMSDIVVTATKTKTPEIELASSISIIDSLEISQKHAATVFGLLRDQYGLSYSQLGGPGQLSYVYLRGAGAGQTLILVDGVEMNMPNDPGNTFDFSSLPADNIERIEILRGPQSTLYGSDALAGVINIITKKGAGKNKISLSAEGGSYNTFKGLGSISGSNNIFNYSLSLSKFKSDGFSAASSKYGNTEKDGSSNINISSRIGADIYSNLTLNLFLRYTKAETDLDQFGGEFGDDPTYIFNLEEQAYRAEGLYSAFGGVWTQKFGISFFRNLRKYHFDSTASRPTSSKSLYDGNRTKIDWQNDFHLSSNNIITFGLETENETASSEYYYKSAYGPYQSVLPENSTRTTGAYIQSQVKINTGIFLTVGVRYDSHTKFGSAFTYRIAPAYLIWTTGTKLKATYGTGFKTPSLFYLFDPVYGNQDLKPERSNGWDAGIEQYLLNNNITLGATYFNNQFKDLIGFNDKFKAININKASSSGVEVYAAVNPINQLKVKFNYTLTNTKNLSENSADKDLPLLRKPKHKIGLNISYDFLKDANANIEYIYVGKRDDKDFSTFPAKRVVLDAYSLVNLSATYNLSELVQLYGRVDNLLNTYYEDVLGYATPGLSGYLGIKLNF